VSHLSASITGRIFVDTNLKASLVAGLAARGPFAPLCIYLLIQEVHWRYATVEHLASAHEKGRPLAVHQVLHSDKEHRVHATREFQFRKHSRNRPKPVQAHPPGTGIYTPSTRRTTSLHYRLNSKVGLLSLDIVPSTLVSSSDYFYPRSTSRWC
jgi:hypothetical protein